MDKPFERMLWEVYPDEIYMAVALQDYPKVQKLYIKLKQGDIQSLEDNPALHLAYLQSFRHEGKIEEAMHEGGVIVKDLVANVKKIAASGSATHETLIAAFTVLTDVIEEILLAGYSAQGKATLPKTESWNDIFWQSVIWLRNKTNSLQKVNEYERSLYFYILNIKHEMWTMRLEHRKLFFEENPAKRRELGQSLEIKAELIENMLKKFRDPETITDQTEKDIAISLRVDPRVRLAILEMERTLAAIQCRSYEWQPGFEMGDENLALPCLFESPKIQAWIESGVSHAFSVMREGEALEASEMPETARNLLNHQLLGAADRLNENLPKILQFYEGWLWFKKACDRAERSGAKARLPMIINNFAYQNLLTLAKLLISPPEDPDLKTHLMNEAEKIEQSLPPSPEIGDSCDPAYFLETALAFANQALDSNEEPGNRNYIERTIAEIYMTMAEYEKPPIESRQRALMKAWQLAQAPLGPENENPYFETDTLLRCKELAPSLGIYLSTVNQHAVHRLTKDSLKKGYALLYTEMQKPKSASFPGRYKSALQKKLERFWKYLNA